MDSGEGAGGDGFDRADQTIPLPSDVEFLVFIVCNHAGIVKHYYTEEDSRI